MLQREKLKMTWVSSKHAAVENVLDFNMIEAGFVFLSSAAQLALAFLNNRTAISP